MEIGESLSRLAFSS